MPEEHEEWYEVYSREKDPNIRREMSDQIKKDLIEGHREIRKSHALKRKDAEKYGESQDRSEFEFDIDSILLSEFGLSVPFLPMTIKQQLLMLKDNAYISNLSPEEAAEKIYYRFEDQGLSGPRNVRSDWDVSKSIMS